jgi:hypothetical protein
VRCAARIPIKTLADSAEAQPARGPCRDLKQQLRDLLDAARSGTALTLVDVREPR